MVREFGTRTNWQVAYTYFSSTVSPGMMTCLHDYYYCYFLLQQILLLLPIYKYDWAWIIPSSILILSSAEAVVDLEDLEDQGHAQAEHGEHEQLRHGARDVHRRRVTGGEALRRSHRRHVQRDNTLGAYTVQYTPLRCPMDC